MWWGCPICISSKGYEFVKCKITMFYKSPPLSWSFECLCWCSRVDCVTITLVVVVMVTIRTSHCHCVDNASVDNRWWQDRTLDKRLFGNFWLWVLGYICEIVKLWKLLSGIFSCLKREYTLWIYWLLIINIYIDNASVDNQWWQDRTLDKRLLGNFRLWVFTRENFYQEHFLVSKGIMSLYFVNCWW